MSIDYLKIGKATDLSGKDYCLYRAWEIFPGFFAWATLLILITLSFLKPIIVAYFIIIFDIYWLLLVLYLSIHLLVAFCRMKKNVKLDWRQKCIDLNTNKVNIDKNSLSVKGMRWEDVVHLVIFPTYNESVEIVSDSFKSLFENGYPLDKIIVVLALEGRAGEPAIKVGEEIKSLFGDKFRNFLITIHEDIPGELKGKGANQKWAAEKVKEQIIDQEKIDYDKILVSIFDMDTKIDFNYFFCLTHKFLTVESPYRASYQPIPVYHNNVWDASFFARIAASSNTFWQMMQQVRYEKLATYSSHSMTWKSLVEVGLWSPYMVSEDSRIFWHSLLHYNGNYRVEPLYFPVSMDIIMDKSFLTTAKNLYKQQRRWGWGVENVPYLIFNTIKQWKNLPKREMLSKIFIQIYGFHSWATNALIIAVIGWLPVIVGGSEFNSSVLSSNLPQITRVLMTIAMFGLVFSAITSTLLLPKRKKEQVWYKKSIMFLEWLLLPIVIIIFGAIPAMESQTRLMFKKYMGFTVTPKNRV